MNNRVPYIPMIPEAGPRPKTCQYIEGEPSDPKCGEPVYRDYSYCEKHKKLCYTVFKSNRPNVNFASYPIRLGRGKIVAR